MPRLATAEEVAAFKTWLREQVERDGRPASVLSVAAGLSACAISHVLRKPSARLYEPNVRRLASFFGDDPDQVAALAGYANVRVAAPDPLLYSTFREWLAAALQARNETAGRAAKQMGLSDVAVGVALRGKHLPTRPILDRYAAYFGVDRGALRAFRPKSAANVARGKALVERIGIDEARRRADAARSKIKPCIPEEQRARASLGGSVSAALRGTEGYRAMQAQSVAARRANAEQRGMWYSSPEVEEQQLLRLRRIQVDGKVARQRLRSERGGSWFKDQAGWEARAAALRNGKDRLCFFCKQPVYRSKSRLERCGSDSVFFHKQCWIAWRRTQTMRDRSKSWGSIGWILSRVKRYGNEKLLARIRDRKRTQLADLREEARGRRSRGRPAVLLRDKKRAMEAARLHDDLGLAKGAVAAQMGLRLYTSESRYTKANRYIDELIDLGRALRGWRGGNREENEQIEAG